MKECEVCGETENETRIINSNKFNKMLCDICYGKEKRNFTKNNDLKCDVCNKENVKLKTYTRENKFNKILCESCYRKEEEKHLEEQGVRCEFCGAKPTEKGITNSRELNSYLCQKHYSQYLEHGEMFERTIYDKNNYEKYENYAVINTYDKNCNIKNKTKIDLEDLEKVLSKKWRCSNNGYIKSNDNLLLHRFIMDCPKDKVVDHINGDKTDNRKSNLRICSQSENLRNSKISKDNNSGYKGVSFHKASGKWRARITVNKDTKYLGLFKDKEKAIKVRKEAENKYFGEYNYKE